MSPRPCWETFNYFHILDYHHEFALVTHMSFVSHASSVTLTHMGSNIISRISAAVLMLDIHRGLSSAAGLPSSALSSGTKHTAPTWCLGLEDPHNPGTQSEHLIFISKVLDIFAPSYLTVLLSPVISPAFKAYQSARSPADPCFCP